MKTKDTPLCKVYALNPKYWSIECKSVFLPSSSAWNVSLVVTNPFLGTFLKSEKKIFFEGKSLIFWGSTWQSEENIPEGSSNFNLLLVYSKRKKNRSEIEFHTQIHTTGQRNMQGWCSLGDPAVNLHFRPQPFCGKRKEWLAFSVPPWLCAPVRALVCQDPVWKLQTKSQSKKTILLLYKGSLSSDRHTFESQDQKSVMWNPITQFYQLGYIKLWYYGKHLTIPVA